jgi:hypothetical protein
MCEKFGEMLLYIVHLISNGNRAAAIKRCHFVFTVELSGVFIIKPTTCINFTNLFWHETLHLCPSSGGHSLYTQQWYMS